MALLNSRDITVVVKDSSLTGQAALNLAIARKELPPTNSLKNNSGKVVNYIFDISSYITNIRITTGRRAEIGTAVITLYLGENNTVFFNIGSKIKVFSSKSFRNIFDDNYESPTQKVTMFSGIIVSMRRNREGVVTLECEDFMRYMRNKCYFFIDGPKPSQTNPVKVFAGKLIEECLNSINFKDSFAKYEISPMLYTKYSYTLYQPMIVYNKTLLNVIQEIINRSIIGNMNTSEPIEEVFIMRHNYETDKIEIGFGQLAFTTATSKLQLLSLGNKSLVYNYEVETSINKQTYTRAIIKEAISEDGQKKNIKMFVNQVAEKYWGCIPKEYDISNYNSVEAMKGTLGGNAGVEKFYENLVKYYSKPTYNVRVNAIGIPDYTAGYLTILNLPSVVIRNLSSENTSGVAIVDTCTHNISMDEHTMDVEFTVGVKDSYLSDVLSSPVLKVD